MSQNIHVYLSKHFSSLHTSVCGFLGTALGDIFVRSRRQDLAEGETGLNEVATDTPVIPWGALELE